METSLHRTLKSLYASRDCRVEAAVHGYRADVLRDGVVVEIQASPLGAIARKVADLLEHTRVLVIKPIAARKILVQRSRPDGDTISRRLSPKKGRLLDVFDDLVRFTRVFPHPNLTIEVVMVEEEELRVPRRRHPGYRVTDRRLVAILASHRLTTATDLAALITPRPTTRFTSHTLASSLGVPVWRAQQITYTLRRCGAARVTGKQGNRLVYELDAAPMSGYAMTAC